MNQTTAKLKYLKIAPRKVRLIADTIRGLSAQEAEAQLLLRIQRSAAPLLKLLRSAIANAKNNPKLDPKKLFISKIFVDQGPMLKRSLPRAMGRATPIQKKMSHVTLVLEEAVKATPGRFVINPPVKKVKTQKGKKTVQKQTEIKKEQPKEKVGFFRRIFRRKSV